MLVLLTNVTEYTGPGALPFLLDDGHTVVCHDRSFSDRGKLVKFAEQKSQGARIWLVRPQRRSMKRPLRAGAYPMRSY